jgi:NTE family protein
MAKTAFVLAGGGAKGCFQVGVLKQLSQRGIFPEAMWGTSVGAINSAAFAYVGAETTEQIWLDIKGNSDIIQFQIGSMLFATKGLYSTKPLHNLLKENLSDVPPTINPTVCMTNALTGQIAYADPWTCAAYGMTFDEAVLASAAFPLAMEPVHGVWIDGGVRETVPLREAIRNGYDDLYVILCNPWTRNPKPKKEIRNWLGVGARVLDLLSHEIFVNDVQTCLKHNDRETKRQVNIHIYAPNELVIDTLDFNPEKIIKGIKQGYNAQEIGLDFVRAL